MYNNDEFQKAMQPSPANSEDGLVKENKRIITNSPIPLPVWGADFSFGTHTQIQDECQGFTRRILRGNATPRTGAGKTLPKIVTGHPMRGFENHVILELLDTQKESIQYSRT